MTNIKGRKRKLEIFGFCIGWFAVISQFILMFQTTRIDTFETIIRFFSFFTILTNILVALYFTIQAYQVSKPPFNLLRKNGALTAITTFIFIVGFIYQIALRNLWNPTGFNYIIDELLHTVIPLFVLVYWCLYIKRDDLNIKSLALWLIYPIIYISFILLRGYFTNFYPYPFLNVTDLGYQQTFINISIIFAIAIFVMMILRFIGKRITKARP